MSYRPKNWKNQFDWYRGRQTYSEYPDIYEAGADAMLEGLTSQEHQDFLATTEGESCKGKWVFIPDKELL